MERSKDFRGTLGLLVLVMFLFCLAAPAGVNAQKVDKLVVSSAGGIWKESAEKNFIPCFEKRTGVKVEVMISPSADLLNRIRANPSNPPIHVAMLSELDALRGGREGLLEEVEGAHAGGGPGEGTIDLVIDASRFGPAGAADLICRALELRGLGA